MDGVFQMQDYYAKGGVLLAHRSMPFCHAPDGPALPPPDAGVGLVALGDIAFDAVADYDRGCFPARREDFLARWIAQPEALFLALARFAPEGPLYLDAPEVNAAAMALVRRHGMAEGFGCARMYLGPAPMLHHDRIFGLSSFELG